MAANSGKVEGVRTLLAAGAPVDAIAESMREPLHWAAMAGFREVCEALLEAGASPTAEDSEGATAQSLAMSHGHAELSDVLDPARTGTYRSSTPAHGHAAAQHAGFY